MIFFRLYRAKCSACLQHIVPPNQLVMRALDHVYHMHCFACVACGHPLQKGEEFVVKHGQIFCRMDFEKEMALMPYSPKSKCNVYTNAEWLGSLSTMKTVQLCPNWFAWCLTTNINCFHQKKWRFISIESSVFGIGLVSKYSVIFL